jgi:hypothetical protein
MRSMAHSKAKKETKILLAMKNMSNAISLKLESIESSTPGSTRDLIRALTGR